MLASDIAKLAASIAAGSVSYDMARSRLSSDGDISLLDSILSGGAGALGGAIGGRVVSEVMDRTGVTDLIDDTVGSIFGGLF